jgi:copper chaperone
LEERRVIIHGMSCNHCVMAVRKALMQIPNITIKDVQVGSAVIESADPAALPLIQAAVEKAGYTVVS